MEGAISEPSDLPVRYKLDVDAYQRMGAAGILSEDDRVELIEGELIEMAPIGSDHAATVNGMAEALFAAFRDKAIVSVQNPVRIGQYTEPQPDFTVLRMRADRYRTATPGPADVLVLIEVADSSLRYDTKTKRPLYALAGIAEYWIVDLSRRAVVAHRRPEGDRYTEVTVHGSGETLSLTLAPEVAITLTRVFD